MHGNKIVERLSKLLQHSGFFSLSICLLVLQRFVYVCPCLLCWTASNQRHTMRYVRIYAWHCMRPNSKFRWSVFMVFLRILCMRSCASRYLFILTTKTVQFWNHSKAHGAIHSHRHMDATIYFHRWLVHWTKERKKKTTRDDSYKPFWAGGLRAFRCVSLYVSMCM